MVAGKKKVRDKIEIPPTIRKNSGPRGITEQQICNALVACDGLISETSKMLGCGYVSLSERIQMNPQLQKVQKMIKETTIDRAERALFSLVRDLNVPSVHFTLKTVGKHRGYVEEQKVSLDESFHQGLTDMKAMFSNLRNESSQAIQDTSDES